MTQYKITMNNVAGPVLSSPSPWPTVAQTIEDRGGLATLESRAVFARTDDDRLFLDGLRDGAGALPRGWMVLPTVIVSSWRVAAQVEVR